MFLQTWRKYLETLLSSTEIHVICLDSNPIIARTHYAKLVRHLTKYAIMHSWITHPPILRNLRKGGKLSRRNYDMSALYFYPAKAAGMEFHEPIHQLCSLSKENIYNWPNSSQIYATLKNRMTHMYLEKKLRRRK